MGPLSLEDTEIKIAEFVKEHQNTTANEIKEYMYENFWITRLNMSIAIENLVKNGVIPAE